MKKQYLNTLIALAVLAALWGAFSYVGRKKKEKPSKAKGTSSEKVVPVTRDHITSFTLKPRDGKPITCVRQDGKNWQITAPLKLAASHSAVDGFLSSLTGATVDEVVNENPASLKDFGLAPPHETIELATNAKPSGFTLRLGSATPTSQGVYAQVAGQKRVIMLASYLKSSLEKNLFDLRDKRVVTLPSDQIERLSVASKKGSYTLVKDPEGVWDLDLPPPVRADHFTVEGLVDQLGSASMQSVVEEQKSHLGRYGFSDPALTLHLRGPGGAETLVVGKKQGGNYYAMNTARNCVFTLSSDFLTEFQKKPSDLRSKDLFTFPTFEAKKITVRDAKGRLVFQKVKDKWGQSEPVSKVEPGAKVEDLLDALRNLSAQSFPQKQPTDLAAYGLTKPAYTFQVEYGNKGKTQTVQIAKVGQHVYARRSTDLVPSELSPKALHAIEKALHSL